MKANPLRWFLLFLLLAVTSELPAQQSEADRKLLTDIRAKAEKGDAVVEAGALIVATTPVGPGSVGGVGRGVRHACGTGNPHCSGEYSSGEAGLASGNWYRAAGAFGCQQAYLPVG